MLYFIARVILIPFIYLLFWPKVKGKENCLGRQCHYLCQSHFSLDPILLGCLLPRKIYFMAKQELFKFPPAGTVLKLLGAFPVKRGTADITAIKTAPSHPAEGNVFGIFPEGTRSKSGNLQNFTHGIAAIAHKSRAVAVPVKISGGYKLFHSIQVTIWKPLDFKQYYGKKSSSELLDRISEEMSEAVKSLA